MRPLAFLPPVARTLPAVDRSMHIGSQLRGYSAQTGTALSARNSSSFQFWVVDDGQHS